MTDPDVFLDLADLFPEPHLLLEADGTILAANVAFRRLRMPKDPTGSPLSSMAEIPGEALEAFLARCARSRSMLPGALDLRDHAGHVQRFRVDGCLARPGDKAGPAWILLRLRGRKPEGFTSLDEKLEALRAELARRERVDWERARLLEDARKASASAEEANRLKDEFLSTLSHELRTPVNAILGWTALLRDPEVDPGSTERALESIERNAREQARMVEDLLDVSRMTAGMLDLDLRVVDLVQIVRDVADALRPAARAKRITLEVVVRTDDGAPTRGDSLRLRQVAWHLLNNAVRFTPAGGQVVVAVGRLNGDVELVVEDTGRGIAPAFLPHVFDAFRQADQSTTRPYGGLGLGLALVRYLVELHGGTVEAFSEGEGQGARFRVYLPAGEGHGVETPTPAP